jgi:hypothetical protein
MGRLARVEVGVADERLAHERCEEQGTESEAETVLANESLHRAISPIAM